MAPEAVDSRLKSAAVLGVRDRRGSVDALLHVGGAFSPSPVPVPATRPSPVPVPAPGQPAVPPVPSPVPTPAPTPAPSPLPKPLPSCTCIEAQHPRLGTVPSACADHVRSGELWCYVTLDAECDPRPSMAVPGLGWQFCPPASPPTMTLPPAPLPAQFCTCVEARHPRLGIVPAACA